MDKDPEMMSLDIWVNLMKVIRQVTPRCRLELAMCGEPTLHPELVGMLRTGRMISPESQIQITTNGTMLMNGVVTYAELFNAGANIVYVDMYSPRAKHIELAQQSGYEWYEYLNAPPNAPAAWSYKGPKIKFIVLMENPANWPETRRRMGRLGTWLNHLDWDAAAPFGLTPVIEPVQRHCAQPFRHVAVNFEGNYLLCCQDFMGETSGTMGNVESGIAGFKKYWFGKKMQRARRHLRVKDRAGLPECARCNVRFSREGFRLWEERYTNKYWDGETWVPDES